jgi:hypothetical protein
MVNYRIIIILVIRKEETETILYAKIEKFRVKDYKQIIIVLFVLMNRIACS